MSFGSTEKSFVNFLINFEWLLTASCQTKLNEILNLEYLHEPDFTEGAKLRAFYKQNRRKSLKNSMRKFYPLIALEHVFQSFFHDKWHILSLGHKVKYRLASFNKEGIRDKVPGIP